MTSTDSPSKHGFGKPVANSSWEDVQIRAFTYWVNAVLEPSGIIVEDLETGFENGVNLVRFFETLAGPNKHVDTKLEKQPKMRIQKIQNLSIALNFLKEEMGARNVTISAEDFVDKKLKLILGLLWGLYRQYKIVCIQEDAGAVKGEDALLNWCRKQTESYEKVDIRNFTDSFRDGRAFLALVHRFNEEVVDYLELSNSEPGPSGDRHRLAEAFSAAETFLGVPQLLSEEDVAKGSVDERGMVLYVSLFFHAFVAREERERLGGGESAALSTRLSSLEQQLSEKEARARQLEAEKARMSEVLSHKASSLDELEEQNAELRRMLDQMNEKVDRAANEANKYKKHANRLAEAKNSLSEKDSYLEEKVAVLKELLQTETEEKAEMEELIHRLEDKLEAAESARDTAVAAAKEISAEVAVLRDQQAATEGLTETLRLLLTGLGMHVDDLRHWHQLLELEQSMAAAETQENATDDGVTTSPAAADKSGDSADGDSGVDDGGDDDDDDDDDNGTSRAGKRTRQSAKKASRLNDKLSAQTKLITALLSTKQKKLNEAEQEKENQQHKHRKKDKKSKSNNNKKS